MSTVLLAASLATMIIVLDIATVNVGSRKPMWKPVTGPTAAFAGGACMQINEEMIKIATVRVNILVFFILLP